MNKKKSGTILPTFRTILPNRGDHRFLNITEGNQENKENPFVYTPFT
jgi:hypothetical protein